MAPLPQLSSHLTSTVTVCDVAVILRSSLKYPRPPLSIISMVADKIWWLQTPCKPSCISTNCGTETKLTSHCLDQLSLTCHSSLSPLGWDLPQDRPRYLADTSYSANDVEQHCFVLSLSYVRSSRSAGHHSVQRDAESQ